MTEPNTDYYDQDTLGQDLNEGTTVRDDIRNVVLTHESGIAEVRVLPSRRSLFACVHLAPGAAVRLIGKMDQRIRVVVVSFGVNASLSSDLGTARNDANAALAGTTAPYGGFILPPNVPLEWRATDELYAASLQNGAGGDTIISYLQEFREG